MKPKLVSDRYMKLLNHGLQSRDGRDIYISKKQFMSMLSILSRGQQKLLLEQFGKNQ